MLFTSIEELKGLCVPEESCQIVNIKIGFLFRNWH